MANFTRQFMQALDIQKASLVGASAGGGVALTVSVKFPELVDKLVIVGSAGLGKEVSLLLRLPTIPILGKVFSKPSKSGLTMLCKQAVYNPKKALLPRNFLNKEVSAIIEAYFEINHLKQLYRQGWLQRGVPPHLCESVAEHSFCVTLLSLFLADAYFPELDKSKVICMSLLHDIGEIYAGDLTPLDNVEAQVKQNLERQS